MWLPGLFLCLLLVVSGSGCATRQPAAPADPFADLEAMDVHFLHVAPHNAKFLGRVMYSRTVYDNNWSADYDHYLRVQAVKMGGNVVIPSGRIEVVGQVGQNAYSEQDRAVQSHQFGAPIPAPSTLSQPGPGTTIHFWSSVYHCPDYD